MGTERIAYKLVRWCGLPWLFREVLFRRSVRILTFHDPAPDAFRRVLGYLHRHYGIITLDDHLSGKPLPAKPVVVTLDDGHIGNHALIPVLREFAVRPVVFVCAGLVGTNRRFWFKHAARSGSSEGLKRISDAERLRILAADGFTPLHEYDVPQALGLEQLKELASVADIGAHTLFHPCLHQCTSTVADAEIVGSKHVLEELLGHPVDGFAFPNGDYSSRDAQLVSRAGFRYACTSDHGFNRSGGTFLLKRISVDDTGDVDALSVKASGVWALLRAVMGRQRLHGEQPVPVEHATGTHHESLTNT